MPKLELEAPEVALLRLLVKWRLSSLALELSHTDSREYKDMLRGQRDQLERLEEKLAASST